MIAILCIKSITHTCAVHENLPCPCLGKGELVEKKMPVYYYVRNPVGEREASNPPDSLQPEAATQLPFPPFRRRFPHRKQLPKADVLAWFCRLGPPFLCKNWSLSLYRHHHFLQKANGLGDDLRKDTELFHWCASSRNGDYKTFARRLVRIQKCSST